MNQIRPDLGDLRGQLPGCPFQRERAKALPDGCAHPDREGAPQQARPAAFAQVTLRASRDRAAERNRDHSQGGEPGDRGTWMRRRKVNFVPAFREMLDPV